MDIFEDESGWCNPKFVVRFVPWRLYPFEDLIDVKDEFKLFREKSHCMNLRVMPAHHLEIRFGPDPLFNFVFLTHISFTIGDER